MDMPDSIRPRSHHVRLLLPLRLEATCADQTSTRLTQYQLTGRKRDWQVWERPEKAPELYQPEAWPLAADFLFGQGKTCCRYVRVPAETANYLFKNGVEYHERRPPDSPAPEEAAAAGPLRLRLAGEGIELFITPFQVGMLSLTFQVQDEPTLPEIQALNYRLSQRRAYTACWLQLPIGERAPDRPPTDQEPIARRLGMAGAGFTLPEFCDWLLAPLKESGYEPSQNQFSLFGVTRFAEGIVFDDMANQRMLGQSLISLAHVEEREHPGSTTAPQQLLNPKHWAACCSLASAHLIADQAADHHFNDQRTAVVVYRYFIPYLLASLQRQTLHRLLHEAAAANDLPDDSLPERQSAIRRLHRERVRFGVKGHFSDIGSREVLNQYYALCQTGLRVPEALNQVQSVLYDLETSAELQQQQRTTEELRQLASGLAGQVDAVVAIQGKVEWLEVFFVSYYATALVHYIGHGNFTDHYNHISIVVAPILSGLLALWGIKPYQVHAPAHDQPMAAAKPHHREKTWLFLMALLLGFGLWIGVGFYKFPVPPTDQAHPANAPAATPSPPAQSNHE